MRTEGAQTIQDPIGDALFPQGDVTSAGVTADSSGMTTVVVVVNQWQSPLSDDWQLALTDALWDFDIDTDGRSDYYALLLGVDDQVLAGVFETSDDPNLADTLVCDATPEYSQQQRSYSAHFSTSCIDGPPSFRWAVDMTFEDYDTEVQSLDSAPDISWAGPVVNDAYAPCVPGTVLPPGPASDGFVPLVPARILDTRPGQPTIDCAFAGGGRVGATSVQLVVAGRGGVPADASAVVLNLTATDATSPGFLTAYPCGGSLPIASNVNYLARETRANAAIVQVGLGGAVCIYSMVPAHLIADVTGYFNANASYVPVIPGRQYDSRNLSPTPRPAGSVLVTGAPGRAGVFNVTVVDAQTAGFATVYPCGTMPTASSVNFGPREAAANLVVATTSNTGSICIYLSATAHLIVDYLGYFPSTAAFHRRGAGSIARDPVGAVDGRWCRQRHRAARRPGGHDAAGERARSGARRRLGGGPERDRRRRSRAGLHHRVPVRQPAAARVEPELRAGLDRAERRVHQSGRERHRLLLLERVDPPDRGRERVLPRRRHLTSHPGRRVEA